MKKRIFAVILGILLFSVAALPAAYNLHMLGSGGEKTLQPALLIQGLLTEPKIQLFFLLLVLLAATLIIGIAMSNLFFDYKTGMIKITPEISIPAAAGQGQYGTAFFLSPDNYPRVWSAARIDTASARLKKLMEHGQDDLNQEGDYAEFI